MLRQIKSSNNLSGTGEKRLLKRRLIPVELVVGDKGDYITFRKKLPHNTKKVAGIIITSDTPPEIIIKYKIVWGAGAPRPDNEYYMRAFTIYTARESELLLEGYEARENEYVYYAQPKSMPIPIIRLNGRLNHFRSPVTINKVSHIDLNEDLYLWRSRQHSLGITTIEVVQTEGSGNSEDDEQI